MKKVAVITESSSCVPREMVDQYGIRVLPLILVIEDRSYRDGVDMTSREFYELLTKVKRLPTSSSPSPGEYLEVFTELSRDSDSIFCVSLPPHLGMAYNAAMEAKRLAREILPEMSIEVFPCRGPALTQAFIAQAAAEAANAGESLARVVKAANDRMDKMHAFAVLDTFYYLAKGGRIPRAAAWAGSLFKIKPILDATNDVKLCERTRTKKRALERLLEIMEQRAQGRPVHVNLMHANDPDEAQNLKAAIMRQLNCVEFYITDFTPVIGAHTGPGTLGVAFYSDVNDSEEG
ncbi:MAG: DegV family protein [Dehalococcoidia bacterium]|nr:DegV family protein [Dehalococcoidia bacterium]